MANTPPFEPGLPDATAPQQQPGGPRLGAPLSPYKSGEIPQRGDRVRGAGSCQALYQYDPVQGVEGMVHDVTTTILGATVVHFTFLRAPRCPTEIKGLTFVAPGGVILLLETDHAAPQHLEKVG